MKGMKVIEKQKLWMLAAIVAFLASLRLHYVHRVMVAFV